MHRWPQFFALGRTAADRTIQTTYLGAADGKLRLRMADGREMNVPLSKFSQADIAYVEQMQAASKSDDDPFER
jgi:hypothetical protein